MLIETIDELFIVPLLCNTQESNDAQVSIRLDDLFHYFTFPECLPRHYLSLQEVL
jgi:hypothetical protein